MNQEKKPDEIYCPSCSKPIKKDAVVCPRCGVQVKELKTSVETMAMTPEEEIEEGRKQLGGVKILMWWNVIAIGIVCVIYFFIGIVTSITEEDPMNFLIVIFAIFIFGIFSIPAIFALSGIKNRKLYTVNLVRVLLVLTMFNIPVGTIIGAVLWSRINHPLAKKYLNYSG
ncbi:MAG: hypothetical protein E3J77_04715 [Actinobacteria bacterium]|nr:MAG: hypothetical protein E3J77_04715 [Actinomycetota bacterium]